MTNSSIHAPEIAFSADPEVDHDPRSFPPEVASVEGLEATYDGLEQLNPDTLQSAAVKQIPRKKNPLAKLTWPWIVLLAAVIVAVGVGVGVGSNLRHHSRTSAQPFPSTTTTPDSSGDSPGTTPTILTNSSIASSICPDGDRWVFFQDPQGYLRGTQYQLSNYKWTVTSSHAMVDSMGGFVHIMPGTPLSASCTDISHVSSLADWGPLLVQVAYLDTKRFLGWCRFHSGTWEVYPNISTTVASDTKISISTSTGPTSSGGNNYNISSVAFYKKSNGSYAVADLMEDEYISVDPEVNSSNRSAERQLHDLPSETVGSDFTCVYNVLVPPEVTLHMMCLESGIIHFWLYSQLTQSVQLDAGAGFTFIADLGTSDVSLTIFSVNTAVVSVVQGAIFVYTAVPYVAPSNTSYSPTTKIPLKHVSGSSSRNSSMLYIYYQFNDTALAEVTFSLDTANPFSAPVYIPIPSE